MSLRRREFLIGMPRRLRSPAAARAAGEYSSDVRIHDPVMIRERDTYYLFGTGRGIAVHSSRDLKSWKKEPPVFDTAAGLVHGRGRELPGPLLGAGYFAP